MLYTRLYSAGFDFDLDEVWAPQGSSQLSRVYAQRRNGGLESSSSSENSISTRRRHRTADDGADLRRASSLQGRGNDQVKFLHKKCNPLLLFEPRSRWQREYYKCTLETSSSHYLLSIVWTKTYITSCFRFLYLQLRQFVRPQNRCDKEPADI